MRRSRSRHDAARARLVLGPTRTYAQVIGGNRQGSVAGPSSEGGGSWELLLLEGLDGPTPQDAVTSEIQSNFTQVIALIRQHNDRGEGSPLPPAEPMSLLESFWGPRGNPNRRWVCRDRSLPILS